MKRLLAILFFCLLFVQTANAVTAWYQPTPYPLKKADGSSMPKNDVRVVHLLDGWVNNWFGPSKSFQDADQMKIGGYGDTYASLIKFDLTGLPQQADNAYFYLYSLSRGGATPSQVALFRATEYWDTSIVWGDQTQSGYPENYYPWLPNVTEGYAYSPSPSENIHYGMWVTSYYNGWKSGASANEGIVVYPNDGVNNQFDYFASSNHTNDALRPILRLDFAPTLELKIPLPGNIRWLVTTEIGGYDCKGEYDKYHADETGNYFSIDFSWRNKNDAELQVYPNPDPYGNRQDNGIYIPVIAAAGGYVKFARWSDSNGWYVVIDHDNDGNLATGFQTRYLHLQPPGPTVAEGIIVQQGDTLGYMGNTGISSGAHLHFGVRYADSGLSTVSALTKVVMDGWILKSFQTECTVNASGIPTDWNRYYRSGNRVY